MVLLPKNSIPVYTTDSVGVLMRMPLGHGRHLIPVSIKGICLNTIRLTRTISCKPFSCSQRLSLILSIGEHTSINHAWIFSALESSVRGVVQLLLDDGLVDEAQQVSPVWQVS